MQEMITSFPGMFKVEAEWLFMADNLESPRSIVLHGLIQIDASLYILTIIL